MRIGYHVKQIVLHVREKLSWRSTHHFHLPHVPAVDFLHTLRAHHQQRRRYWKWGWVVGSVIIVVALVVGGLGLSRAWTVAEKAARAKSHLLYSVDLLREQEFAAAIENMHAADRLLGEARETLRPWLVFRVLPIVGRNIRAVDVVMDAGQHLTRAVEYGAVFGQELVIALVGVGHDVRLADITQQQKRVLLERLSFAPPTLRKIDDEVRIALALMSTIPKQPLAAPVDEVVRPLREVLPRLHRTITLALPFLEAAPLVSGFQNEQAYLFLFQNNDELRPTGGFIGTYGVLRVRDAEIEEFVTDNIYRLDRQAERRGLDVPPPSPLREYLNVKRWYLRDSNWSPDFPEAARQALWFYEKESAKPQPIDGVVAVTPSIVERLLRLVGPMTVDKTTFTPENLVDTLQYHVEQRYVALGLPDIERKEIVGRLATELIAQLKQLPVQRIPDMVDIVRDALLEKQVLLYATDERVQDIITGEGWDGSIRDSAGDYAMVVDANLAALKTDSVMDRSITYAMEPEGKRLKATMRIAYKNTGRFSWKTTRYRSYTRIYLPSDVALQRVTGFLSATKPWGPLPPTITEKYGKTVVAGFINVEPNTSHTVTLEYLLPERIGRDGYTLLWQKQPGTVAIPLTVSAAFDTTIDTWSPTGLGVKVRGKHAEFRSDLRFDREFSVSF